MPQITTNENNATHAHETAGHLMIHHVPMVTESETIAHIEKLLLEKVHTFTTIDYIFVVNKENALKGVVSIKDLFRAPKSTVVATIMTRDVVTVRTHTDQERVALLAVRHNLKAIPVVDKNMHLLGIVPSDTILKILDSESVEDILRFGGVFHKTSFDDVFHLSILKSLQYRLPWLLLGLGGGILTSGIINHFEVTLSTNLILATFIPLIVYMADAVGTQMEAFIIRDLAVDPKLTFMKYFFRQFSIVSIIGAIVSSLLFGISILLYHNMQISIVISLALFCAILSSIVSGLAIPFLFNKIHLDPANASGPIATILQDVFSVFVYFSIASLLL